MLDTGTAFPEHQTNCLNPQTDIFFYERTRMASQESGSRHSLSCDLCCPGHIQPFASGSSAQDFTRFTLPTLKFSPHTVYQWPHWRLLLNHPVSASYCSLSISILPLTAPRSLKHFKSRRDLRERYFLINKRVVKPQFTCGEVMGHHPHSCPETARNKTSRTRQPEFLPVNVFPFIHSKSQLLLWAYQ